jgi:hypothetical protein
MPLLPLRGYNVRCIKINMKNRIVATLGSTIRVVSHKPQFPAIRHLATVAMATDVFNSRSNIPYAHV